MFYIGITDINNILYITFTVMCGARIKWQTGWPEACYCKHWNPVSLNWILWQIAAGLQISWSINVICGACIINSSTVLEVKHTGSCTQGCRLHNTTTSWNARQYYWLTQDTGSSQRSSWEDPVPSLPASVFISFSPSNPSLTSCKSNSAYIHFPVMGCCSTLWLYRDITTPMWDRREKQKGQRKAYLTCHVSFGVPMTARYTLVCQAKSIHRKWD